MKNDFNPLTVSQMIRQNVANPEQIENQVSETVAEIETLKNHLRNLRMAKFTILKKYDFIKTQAEFDELLNLAVVFPEITSGRQLQVVYYILQFKKAKQIAAICFLTEKAIKWHKTQIYNKLDVMGEKGLMEIYQQRTKK